MRLPSPCGTHAAFVRHWSLSETPCEPCISAERTYQRERWRNRRAARARIDPTVIASLRLDLEDQKLGRCWCGEWTYDSICGARCGVAIVQEKTS